MSVTKPRRNGTVQLNWHKAAGQWTKYVGCYKCENGAVRPKLFYLGGDVDQALVELAKIKAQWVDLRASGFTLWNDLPATEPQPPVKMPEPLTVVPVAPVTTPAQPTTTTIRELVKEYLSELQKRQLAGQITTKHYSSQQTRLNCAVVPLLELPLFELNQPKLEEAIYRLCNRPVYNAKCKHGRKSCRIGTVYAKASIATLKWFCTWLAEEKGWEKPRKCDKLFRTAAVVADDASLAINNDHFEVEELALIAKHCSPLQKAILIFSLNTSACTAEVSSLLKSEIKGLSTSNAHVERLRRKTLRHGKDQAYSKVPLWPETVDLLRPFLSKGNSVHVFVNKKGNCLTKSNSLGQSWPRLLTSAGVRTLPFKIVRKTAAHLMRKIGGREAADMLLSHADSGMIRHYTDRDWDGAFAKHVAELRAVLSPVLLIASRKSEVA